MPRSAADHRGVAAARFGRRVARGRGQREGLAALQALVELRVSSAALYGRGCACSRDGDDAGGGPDPARVDRGELVSLAYALAWAGPAYLVVRDGAAQAPRWLRLPRP